MIQLNQYAMTHGGKFHADDVFSAALLKIMNPDVQIIRAFRVPEEFDGIVFDIGCGKYDHHQENTESRGNDVPYAAFGLLWREFGERIMAAAGFSAEQAAKEAARFDETFVQPLDADDNTGCGSQLAAVISIFNPSWNSEEDSDQCFSEAVDLAVVILKKKLERIRSILQAKELVEAALAEAKERIVILPRFAPWKNVLIPSDAVFVVYPSQRGGYSAQVIPEAFDTKQSKCDFPQEWAGKQTDALRKISGVDTLTFCHRGCFMISADRLDDTIKACKLAWETANKARKEHSNGF